MRRAAGGGRTRWARGLAAAGAIARASASAALVAGATMLGMLGDAGAARAVVLSVEIAKRTPVLEGKAFGEAGAYELIEGIVHFGFDPQNEANARVTDIALASSQGGQLVADRSNPDFYVRGWEESVEPEEMRGLHVERENLVVREIMTPAVYSVPEDTPVSRIAETMIDSHIHRVLVTRGEQVVGIVTSSDLLGLLVEPE